MNKMLAKVVPILLAIAGGVILFVWAGGNRRAEWKARVAGLDGRPAVSADAGAIKIEGVLVTGTAKPSDIAGAWPGFRGANLNGVSDDETALARKWPAEGPKRLWSVDMGEGYAGAAILGGCAYVIDYDQENKADVIRCLSLVDGAEMWRYSYPVKVKRNHGMSRTVPAVTAEFVVTMGPRCHVTCLDAKTGQFRWMLNLVREFGTKVPLWHAGQCPFIEDGRVIIAPGGSCLMMAVDCESGEIVWQTPNEHKWKMTHSSIVPMDFGGARMYVYCGSGGVAGVSATDGKVLWETKAWKIHTNVPTPVIVGADRILLSAGYGKGSMMLRLVEGADGIAVEEVFRLDPEMFGSEQQTPIYYNGFIYGVRPDHQLVCLDAEGKIVWESGTEKTFKKLGPYMIADGLLYVMNSAGVLTVAEATDAGYTELAEADVLDGIEAWGPMAIASGRLIVRDLKQMRCLDVAAH